MSIEVVYNSLGNYTYTTVAPEKRTDAGRVINAEQIKKLDTPKLLEKFGPFHLKASSPPNGTSYDWVYLKHSKTGGRAVMVVPVMKKDGEDHIVFIRTLRPALYAERLAPDSIEVPAGMVGDEREGESIENALRTELEEEGGLKLLDYEILLNNINSAGGVYAETIVLAKATVDENMFEPTSKTKDDGVTLERHVVPVKDVQKWLREQDALGVSINGSTMSALFMLAPQYPELINLPKDYVPESGSRLDYVA